MINQSLMKHENIYFHQIVIYPADSDYLLANINKLQDSQVVVANTLEQHFK